MQTEGLLLEHYQMPLWPRNLRTGRLALKERGELDQAKVLQFCVFL